MHNLLKAAITLFWLLTVFFATAQPTQIFNQPDAGMRTAIRLYEQERYVAAKRQLEKIIDDVFPPSDLESEQRLYREARFYRALSAAQLRQKDADFQLLSFIEDFPEALEVNEAKFYLGQFYFISKKYNEVIPVLASLDAALLPIQNAAAAHD